MLQNDFMVFGSTFMVRAGGLGGDEEEDEYDDDFSYRDWETDRKSTRLNSSHSAKSRMPSSA